MNITLVMLTSTITVIGLSGFFYKLDNILYADDSGFKYLQMLFYLACIVLGNIKIVITIYNAKAIWKLYDVAHDSFLSNKYCNQNNHRVENCGKKFARIFVWYFFMYIMTAFLWSIVPIVVNNSVEIKATQNSENIYMTNIGNLRYPVTAKTYNIFYKSFYALEFITVWYATYGLVVFDLFMVAILQLLATHYEMISSAYENIKCKDENNNSESIIYNI